MSTTYCPISEDGTAPACGPPPASAQLLCTEEVDRAYAQAIMIAASLSPALPVLPIHVAIALLYQGVSDINRLLIAIENSPPVLDTSLLWISLEEVGLTTEGIKTLAKDMRERSLMFTLPIPPSETPRQSSIQIGIEATAGPSTLEVFDAAYGRMNGLGDSYLAVQHLLTALLRHADIKIIFEENDIAVESIIERITRLRSARVHSRRDVTRFPMLSHFSVDLTQRAKDKKLDPVIGRDEEVRRLMVVLSRRKNNNAILIGDPGVGKTAIAHALAQRIVDRDQVPRCLNTRIFSLDMAALVASTQCHGKLELRVKKIVEEIQEGHKAGVSIILHIDDIHMIMTGRTTGGAGGMDIANLLTPPLASGILRCFGGTTYADYKRCLESNGPLTRRFTKIVVCEPSIPEAIQILRGLRSKIEDYHQFKITDGALINAAELAHRYIRYRRLPDSAIDIIDEACSTLRVNRELKTLSHEQMKTKQRGLEIALESLRRDMSGSHDDQTIRQIKALTRDLRLLKRNIKKASDDHEDAKRKVLERKKVEEDIKAKDMEIEHHDERAFVRPRAQLESERKELSIRLENDPNVAKLELVDYDLVTTIVSDQTRIPISHSHGALPDIPAVLEGLIGSQRHAANVLIQAYDLMRTGFTDSCRPTASFLFVGPPGSGKSFVVKHLADNLLLSHNRILRINGNEYTEATSLTRLTGTPSCTGLDTGGVLTECVKRKPFSFVLVEHIDKACIEFRHKFQTIIDSGVLLDGDGISIDFSNCILVMTASNSRAPIRPGSDVRAIRDAMSRQFTVEFLDRMDDIIVFEEPTDDDIARLVNQKINYLHHRLEAKSVNFTVDDEAREQLCELAYSDDEYQSAREVERVIKREVMDRLLQFGPFEEDRSTTLNLHLTSAPNGVISLISS